MTSHSSHKVRPFLEDREIEVLLDDILLDNSPDTDVEDEEEDTFLAEIIGTGVPVRPEENVAEEKQQEDPQEVLFEISDNVCRKWKKTERETQSPAYAGKLGINEDCFASQSTSIDVFLTFLEPIIENLVFQTNLYATQKNKTLAMTKEELLVFLGINQVMGYHQLPSWKHYWNNSPDLNVPIVSNSMSRDRFDAILSNLHLTDNSLLKQDNKDKLYKIRPLLDASNKIFENSYHGTQDLSVDESMILFKGRSTLKQYNPKKPIKRGYKLWCLADQKGYIMKFDIYQGKCAIKDEKFSGYGLGERVVLQLTEKEWGKNRRIIFDNYFSSLRLLEKLKAENTLAYGTIRPNRRDMPTNFNKDKSMKRGDFDYRFSSMIGVFKWMDNRPVFLASNFHGSESDTVSRKQKDGISMTIPCLTVVKDYNLHMGGVDHADRLRVAYGLNRRSKKWWHRLFWGIIDIMVVNSYVVYSELHEKIPLLDFKRSIALALIAHKAPEKKRKAVSSEVPQNKRRKLNYTVQRDVRLSNLGNHYVLYGNDRRRCEVCSRKKIQSRPKSYCNTCKINLCCNENKNCFAEYHELKTP